MDQALQIPSYRLNSPDTANALDTKEAEKLKAALSAAIKAKSPGFIIASTSSKTFCAGGNLKVFQKMKTKNEGVKANEKIRKILSEFQRAPLFIAAAIEGDTFGGGCELALACDFIIMSLKARFAFRQSTQNLTPGWGGAKNLLRRVNPSFALDWLSSGRWVSSAEAMRTGLADLVVPAGDCVEKADEFLQDRNKELIPHLKKMAYDPKADETKIFNDLWWSTAHREALKRNLVT